MTDPVLKVPGVYLQESSQQVSPVLPTGVPAFLGLVTADAPVPDGAPQSGALYGPVALHSKSEFPGGAAAYLEEAVGGFFDNGGAYCYVVGVRANPTDASAAAGLINALELLGALSDVDLIAVPDAMALLGADGEVDESLVREVQLAMIEHCTELVTRVALLDALPGKGAQALIDNQVQPLGVSGARPVNAALYHPWIRTIATDTQFVPPCGHVAGIISRTDSLAGVFKAPANVEILGAIDLYVDLDPDDLALLNTAGVNCLRASASRGIRVWGARTLSSDPAWRYLNVRRLVLTVLRWIDLNMTWAAFEPNVPALWARIQRELSTYLTRLWRDGALQGASASDAFYVRCDAELNQPATREVGQVVTEMGLAPTAPAEFIIVSVRHRAGTTELI
jgi:phage tail sheath protein FI